MTFRERLEAVRAGMARLNLGGFIVPRADEHLGEYVPASAERLAWLTGFTGSAGLAVVLVDRAAVWSDGRYVLQLASQTDPALWERLHIAENPPQDWVAGHIHDGPLGYDPWLISADSLRPFADAGVELVPVAENLVDASWADRPPPPLGPALPHSLDYAGVSSADKRQQIAAILREAKQDAAVITDPASLAWLLNIRGSDVDCTPFALGFAIVHADGHVEVFMDPRKVPAQTREFLGNEVSVASKAALPGSLAAFAGKRVRFDAAGSPAWFGETLKQAGAIVSKGADPCLVPKARKNAVEQEGARRAHRRDAIAVCRFLHWLQTAAGHETEMSAAARLLAFRQELPLFRGESFPAIAGAGEHGAIMHYCVTPETNRGIRPDEVFLIDSGGQYSDGTTDITRTVWTGPGEPPHEVRTRFTLVLKGHIAIAEAVFPDGVAGVRLDTFARAALWREGLDYDHGTGHGVGSYLSVHEGPISISPHLRPAGLKDGMIISNEPGFYLPGHYGIRIENLVLASVAPVGSGGKPYLRFETLTLAPIDRRLIDTTLLTPGEREWIDRYHALVLQEIGGQVPAEVSEFLQRACATLGGGGAS